MAPSVKHLPSAHEPESWDQVLPSGSWLPREPASPSVSLPPSVSRE